MRWGWVKVENLTLDNLKVAVLVILGVMALLVSVEKGIEAFHKLFRKRSEDLQQ